MKLYSMKIFPNLSLGDINVLCRSHPRFANICRNENFWEILTKEHFGIDVKKYDTWVKTYSHYHYVDLVQNLPLSEKIPVIERFLLQNITTNTTNDIISDIIKLNQKAIFQISEPTDVLFRMQNMINRQRYLIPECQGATNPIIIENTNGENIHIHLLSIYDPQTYTLGLLTELNQMRILKLSEGVGWRNPTCAEFLTYKELIERSNRNHS